MEPQYTVLMLEIDFAQIKAIPKVLRRSIGSGLDSHLVKMMAILFFALGIHTALAQDATSNPWHASQVEQPAALARKLTAKAGAKPVLIQVGFSMLYRSKHIPGSIYAGPASTPEGLAMLKKAVAKLPKKSEIYLYCGCCPINKCPNIRPAFAALTSMGFTRLHVVMLSTSFGKDWVAPGYPVAGETASAK